MPPHPPKWSSLNHASAPYCWGRVKKQRWVLIPPREYLFCDKLNGGKDGNMEKAVQTTKRPGNFLSSCVRLGKFRFLLTVIPGLCTWTHQLANQLGSLSLGLKPEKTYCKNSIKTVKQTNKKLYITTESSRLFLFSSQKSKLGIHIFISCPFRNDSFYKQHPE